MTELAEYFDETKPKVAATLCHVQNQKKQNYLSCFRFRFFISAKVQVASK